jgi:hypothetical protein
LLLAASHCDPEFDEAEALKKVGNVYNRYEPNEVSEEEGEEAVGGKQADRSIKLAMADAEELFGLDPGERTDQSFGYRVRRRRSKGCRVQHHAIHRSSEQRR